MQSLFCNRKIHVLIRTHEPQYEPHRNWESPPRRIMHDVGRGKLIFLPTRSKFAAPCREHVPHPLGLATVSEGDDEAV